MKDRLIEIIQDRPGFNPFIGSWICQSDLNLIVDVGPANTGERLINSLSKIPLDRIDYVLITHIHLDHAGALANVLEAYPMARAVCHAEAIPHLVHPERLWSGSLKILGDVARAYGEPRAVPVERLIPHTEASIEHLQVMETPGHALHHLSYRFCGMLYAGEAAGNYLSIDSTDYMRPATPPRFFFDVFLKSLDSLSDLEDQPIRYAHFGEAPCSREMLRRFRDQLFLWKDIIRASMHQGGSREAVIQRSIDLLIEKDPNLAAFHRMGSDAQAREHMLMTNSVTGFVEFLT